MKEYVEIITGIIGILGGIIAIYKINTSKFNKYVERYYKSVLERFYLKCIIRGLDINDFISRENILLKYYSVLPTYVIKLINDINNTNNANIDDDKEKLFKVLYVDFIMNRPSSRNSILKSVTSIFRVINYIMELIYLLLIGAMSATILFNIFVFLYGVTVYHDISITTTLGKYTIDGNIFQLLLILFMLGILVMVIKVADGMIKEYTYSLNTKVIEDQINKKVKGYEKLKNKLILS